ncbi:MAG: SDR family NAD(P)-dependent oxidoreductase [Dehalococcoidia bacterium]
MTYAGKVIIVTGAGSGMGRAMVQEFAARGARVAALGRKLDKLEQSVALAAAHDRAMACRADVSSEADVAATVGKVVEKWGRIDVLCNNAGVLDSYKPGHEVSLQEWNEVMAINATGPFLMSKYVIPHMLAVGKGSIINIASTSSFSAAGGGCAYTASKHAVLGLTRQLCFEYGAKGIRVNAICPGATATPLAIPPDKTQHSPDMEAAIATVPARRWCQPEEVAKMAAFLASDDADYVHGSAYVIDGGWLTAARQAY